MIKINLISRQESDVLDSKPSRAKVFLSSRRSITISAVAVGVLGAVSILVMLTSKQKEAVVTQEVIPQTQGTVPEKPEYQSKVVLSHAVEEIVREIQGEHRETPRYSTYRDMAPAAKVEHQLAICKKALAFIKDVTPDQIGFTDLIITTPGDLYLRGNAATTEDYRNFKEKLSSASFLRIKPGIKKSRAAEKSAQEFSFYGTFKFKPTATDAGRVVNAGDIPVLISRLKKTAKSSGLRLEPVTLKSKSTVGKYKRHIYKTHASNCSFTEFQNFVTTLYVSRSKIGILKFALKAEGNELMTASMDLVMYSN
ncbi:hypothetical protein ACFL5V_13880 [Fibrobacterota bacterium]